LRGEFNFRNGDQIILLGKLDELKVQLNLYFSIIPIPNTKTICFFSFTNQKENLLSTFMMSMIDVKW